VAHGLNTTATTEFLVGAPEGPEKLEKSREFAEREGIEDQVARAYANCAWAAVRRRSYRSLNRHIRSWLDYCDERGLELWRLYLLAYRARSELDQGHWTDAVDSGRSVLRVPRTSTLPRIVALVVLGLVHARTGDLGTWDALDEALALAQPSGELQRIEPVAAARAEAAWLKGKHGAVGPATDSALELAMGHRAGWEIAELACWRRRSGIREETPAGQAGPYALLLAGDWRASAVAWTELGCPYEAALAITDAEDDDALRRSLDKLQQMGARPAAAIVAQRLREQHGAGRLRRRPPT
jgi:hypothetical protein